MSDGSWVDWFPYVFFPFKIIVLGVGMFYSIKWHHDEAKKDEAAKLKKQEAAARSRELERTDDTLPHGSPAAISH